MRYLGIAALLLAVLFISSEYKKRCKEASAELSDFISFLKYMRQKISCFMEDPRRLGNGFRAESEECQIFISKIEEMRGPRGAYLSVRERLSFSKEGIEMLDRVFFSCESGFLNDVLSALDDGIENFEELSKREGESFSVRERLYPSVFITAAVGIALILC